MLLTGTYERTLDDKQRLALPKRLRDSLANQGALILTPGTDGSLALFPEQAFAALTDKLAARSPTGHEIRAFSRLLYARSQNIEIDSQGRIRLPAELVKLAALDRDIVLLGVGDRIELWNKSRWEAYDADLAPRFDELAESALSDRPAGIESKLPADAVTTRPLQPR